MTDDLLDLARRAVASPHWRWMPGMMAVDSTGEEHPGRVIDLHKVLVYEDDIGAIHEGVVSHSDIPDLSDAATLGCAYDLACKALGADAIDVSVGVAPDMSGLSRVMWSARTYRGQRIASGSTLSRHVREASYVAALEAADD